MFSHVLMCLRTQSLSAFVTVLTCWNASICPFRPRSFIYEQRVTQIPVFERSGFKSNYQLPPRRKRSSREMQWRDMESSNNMSLKSKNLPLKNWQDVLPDVRSLLCTPTNETPHERFFGFSRRSSAGASNTAWLATPEPMYIKCQVRTSKMDTLLDEVELLQANPHYVHVRYPDGR